eukprot:SAG22_NODE_5338_length_1034_cov_1.045989_2_plen_128_part_01
MVKFHPPETRQGSPDQAVHSARTWSGSLCVPKDQKNAKITEYSGEGLTRAQVDARYGDKTAEYTLCLGDGPTAKCRDGRNTNSGAGRFANTARGPERRNNAKFTNRTFNMKATTTIKAGHDVFVGHGP